MLATIRNYPRTVNLLLSATLLLTLAKAITFPYLVIYLTDHFALSISQVGLVIGSSLIVGSLLSVYGGFLVDRIDSYRLLLALSVLFVPGFYRHGAGAEHLGVLQLPDPDQPGFCGD